MTKTNLELRHKENPKGVFIRLGDIDYPPCFYSEYAGGVVWYLLWPAQIKWGPQGCEHCEVHAKVMPWPETFRARGMGTNWAIITQGEVSFLCWEEEFWGPDQICVEDFRTLAQEWGLIGDEGQIALEMTCGGEIHRKL